MNLVGWWLAGSVIYHGIVLMLARTFVQKVAFETVGAATTAAELVVLSFAALTAGAVVGARVFRSPLVVGALVALFPDGLFLVFALVAGPQEVAIIAAYVLVPAAIAGTTARLAWRRRPRALRAA